MKTLHLIGRLMQYIRSLWLKVGRGRMPGLWSIFKKAWVILCALNRDAIGLQRPFLGHRADALSYGFIKFIKRRGDASVLCEQKRRILKFKKKCLCAWGEEYCNIEL